MRPFAEVFNQIHRISFHAVIGGNDMVWATVQSNCAYIIVRYLSAVFSEYFSCHSSFLPTILHVVSLRPNEKVRRIDARWRVAVVQHVHAVWNWAMRKRPRQAMGISRIVPTFILSIYRQTPVPFIVHLCLPDPTRLRFQDFRPETLRKCKIRFSHNVIASNDREVVRSAGGLHPFRASSILSQIGV